MAGMTARRSAALGLALLAAGGAGATLGLLGHPARTISRTSTEVVFVATGHAAVPPAPEPATVTVSTLDPGGTAPVEALLPADAELTRVSGPRSADPTVVLVWRRELLKPAGGQQLGLAVWEHVLRGGFSIWSRIFSLRASNLEKSRGVEDLQVSTGDVTADGRDDLLVFEDKDGSAGCGTYLLFHLTAARARRLFSRDLCLDSGTVRLAHGRVVIRRGIDFAGPGIHCCYRRTRVTTFAWNGRSLHVVADAVRPNRTPGLWPPG